MNKRPKKPAYWRQAETLARAGASCDEVMALLPVAADWRMRSELRESFDRWHAAFRIGYRQALRRRGVRDGSVYALITLAKLELGWDGQADAEGIQPPDWDHLAAAVSDAIDRVSEEARRR